MNVLVIGNFYADGFATHIAGTFERMGHSIRRYKVGVTGHGGNSGVLGKYWRKAKSRLHDLGAEISSIRNWQRNSFWEMLGETEVDFTVVTHDAFFWPEEIGRIQSLTRGRVVLWFPDHIGNLSRGYCVTAPYDGLFFKDPFIVEQLQDLCLGRVYYLPQCFDPVRQKLPSSVPDEGMAAYRCEVATAGTLHSYRVGLFRQLEEYDVKLWGSPSPRWMDPGPVKKMFENQYVVYEEKAKAFRGAKVVVNNQHPGEVWGVNKRTFEAAGIGGFQLVTWRPGLEQLFSVGEELVAYRGISDLKDKIDYYLERDEERTEIAKRARERALRDHTYEQRLSLMMDTIFGDEDGHPHPEGLRFG
ncbi:CgeB family protein [Salinibacter ruber]|uniref:CgeB family protein n=1 Tax=Salinibacter ruber TaxID=146919 RepID=UPI0021682200|nr:spore maturation protein CgeB [Salinibacter ruber]